MKRLRTSDLVVYLVVALSRCQICAINICMDAQQLLQDKRPEILAIAARYGAANLRVFGSVARGDSGPASDFDFLVDLQPGRTLLDLGGLLYDLQILLGREVDVVTESGLRPRIRERVLREAVPL